MMIRLVFPPHFSSLHDNNFGVKGYYKVHKKEIIMGYLAVKDLKKTRFLRERLEKERELILTKDGQPFALIIGIAPENVERSLAEIRRARFSTAVMGARQKAASNPPEQENIDDEILKSRKKRGIK